MKMFLMQENGFPEIIEYKGLTFLFKNLIKDHDKALYEYAYAPIGFFKVLTDFKEISRQEIMSGKFIN